jgi:hypothetical protein
MRQEILESLYRRRDQIRETLNEDTAPAGDSIEGPGSRADMPWQDGSMQLRFPQSFAGRHNPYDSETRNPDEWERWWESIASLMRQYPELFQGEGRSLYNTLRHSQRRGWAPTRMHDFLKQNTGSLGARQWLRQRAGLPYLQDGS